MNQRIRSFCALFLLCSLGLTGRSLAQTIVTGFSSTTVCPGGVISVTITTTGSFSANNQFSIQLSDVIGSFSATPIVIGTSSTTGVVSVTVPSETVNGSGYRVRAVSTRPVVTGSLGLGVLTVSKPPRTNPTYAPPNLLPRRPKPSFA